MARSAPSTPFSSLHLFVVAPVGSLCRGRFGKMICLDEALAYGAETRQKRRHARRMGSLRQFGGGPEVRNAF